MPRNLSDWDIRMFFVSDKLPAITIESAKQLRSLQFAAVRQQLTRVPLDHCNFVVLLIDVEVSLDTMGFDDQFA
jgi:hypothetical protein